jgi:hypothetical protein
VAYRLTEDEAWSFIESAHTGIFTTLRRDGVPIALPVWFAATDRQIWIAAPAATKKVRRLEHDPRASFLVEAGERWQDLTAVHLTGSCELVRDLAHVSAADALLGAKYRPYRTAPGSLAAETEAHYARRVFIRFLPERRMLTWRNAGQDG